jgi:hypothetical protein
MFTNNNVLEVSCCMSYQVVSVLLDHSTFIKDLFGELKSTNLEQSKKMDLVSVVRQCYFFGSLHI